MYAKCLLNFPKICCIKKLEKLYVFVLGKKQEKICINKFDFYSYLDGSSKEKASVRSSSKIYKKRGLYLCFKFRAGLPLDFYLSGFTTISYFRCLKFVNTISNNQLGFLNLEHKINKEKDSCNTYQKFGSSKSAHFIRITVFDASSSFFSLQ